MGGRRIGKAVVVALLLLIACTGYVSAQTEAQTEAPMEAPTATSVPAPLPTLTPAPMSAMAVPPGWKRVEDERLGYSLAVPFTWLTFDLHSGAIGSIAGLLGGEEVVALLREFLDSPEGRNFGILAIEPDVTQLFVNPPFPPFLNVSIAPWPDDVTAEQLVAFLQGSAEDINEIVLHSILTGSLNGLPAMQAFVTANMSELGFDVSPYFVVTVLRANRTAYILTMATRLRTAAAKQPLFDQIVGTFLPNIQTVEEGETLIRPVGADFASGVYVGSAPAGQSCTWKRLSDFDEDSESIIATDVHEGLFYVEVLDSDMAFAIDCAVMPIWRVPARAELLKSVPAGMYIVGRDIAPGLYRGNVPAGSSCAWERLNGLTGDDGHTVAAGAPAGRYYVVVVASDYGVRFDCPVEKVE